MTENNLIKIVQIAASKIGLRIFRNNTGTGWVGATTKISRSGSYFCTIGDVIVRDARILRAGLCKGSSDLIGWKEVVVTEEMVGNKIAIFVAIEVKTKKTRISKEQKKFVSQIEKSGGKAGFFIEGTDVDEFLKG